MNCAIAQKTTGVKTLGSVGMTAKLDLDNTLSIVTLTLTGPSDRWFSIGLNATQMTSSPYADLIVCNSATTIKDAYLTGRSNPISDPTQNWTLTSNTVASGVRTIVATRPLNSGEATYDYAFNYNTITSINVIYARNPTASYSYAGGHTTATRGSTTMTFTTLGTTEFSFSDKINVYPNPSTGFFSISKDNAVSITKIRVFDMNAKLLKEIDTNEPFQTTDVNLTGLSKGIYFMEISNNEDKTVKKIQIN